MGGGAGPRLVSAGSEAPAESEGVLTWDELVDEARALGYEVELREFLESAEIPGLLGTRLGNCNARMKRILVTSRLTERGRCMVLEHELEHARDPKGEQVDEIEESWAARHPEIVAELVERGF
jgi:hypothetical protein